MNDDKNLTFLSWNSDIINNIKYIKDIIIFIILILTQKKMLILAKKVWKCYPTFSNLKIMAVYEFQRGAIRILLSTDLSSRGIDVLGVSLISNFEIPPQVNSVVYLHRIGCICLYGGE